MACWGLHVKIHTTSQFILSNFKSSWMLPITLLTAFCTRHTYVNTLRRAKNFKCFKQKEIAMIFIQLSPGISIAWNSFGFGLWRSGWCEPKDFLQMTEAAGAKHFTWGRKTTWRSVVPRLYLVLIEDLNFYILCSRPCRALEKGFKLINTYIANNSICKGHVWF